MKSLQAIFITTSLVICVLFSQHSFAGSTQNKAATFSAEKVATFAKQVEKYAAAQGARAFIIARAGRPESELPSGIAFTHTAVAVYSNITLTSGEQVQGYAIHNLYQNAEQLDKSSLVVDYPVDFFWGVNTLKAGIIIPSEQLQHRLIKAIADGSNQQLHNQRYSVIANPFNNQFQNCTEHTLNLINAAIYQTTDLSRIKANTQAYFKPQRVKINPVKLMLGKAFMDDVTTKDHQNKIYTATFTTIGKYLADNQLLQQAVVLQNNNTTPLL